MAQGKSPAFQFYPRDWITGTLTMTCAERGAYINLLASAWDGDGLPTSDEALRRIAGAEPDEWTTIRDGVMSHFESIGGRYRNTRIEEEREKQRAWSEKSREGGKASAGARRDILGSADPRTNAGTTCEPPREPLAQPNVNSASASASSSSSTGEKEIAADAAPSPKRARKPAEPPDSRVRPFILWFAAESESITHVPYAIEWQRDGAIIKALYRTYCDRTLRELAWSLLHTADDWHDKIGRTITTLKRQANVLAERRAQTLRVWQQRDFTDEQLGLAQPTEVAS